VSARALRSRIYDCQLTHWRAQPVRNRFRCSYFTFCLDLDELDELPQHSWLFRLGVFRFLATDFVLGQKSGNASQLKATVVELARHKGVATPVARVELVAHLRTFGYVFNPAAFYFCYDGAGRVLCAVVEVTNTFGEKKTYFISAENSCDDGVLGEQPKLFYVSPFVALDSTFRFRLQTPAARLRLRIDSYSGGTAVVKAAVLGRSRRISDLALLARLFTCPLVTIGVILRIHLEALRLYLRGVPFIRMREHPELQRKGIS
jgi:DUF1365 family protein